MPRTAPAPAAPSAVPAFDAPAALLHAFVTNERVNQYLLEQLDDAAWRAAPPGGIPSDTRPVQPVAPASPDRWDPGTEEQVGRQPHHRLAQPLLEQPLPGHPLRRKLLKRTYGKYCLHL